MDKGEGDFWHRTIGSLVAGPPQSARVTERCLPSFGAGVGQKRQDFVVRGDVRVQSDPRKAHHAPGLEGLLTAASTGTIMHISRLLFSRRGPWINGVDAPPGAALLCLHCPTTAPCSDVVHRPIRPPLPLVAAARWPSLAPSVSCPVARRSVHACNHRRRGSRPCAGRCDEDSRALQEGRCGGDAAH